jgi:hypothetical protein
MKEQLSRNFRVFSVLPISYDLPLRILPALLKPPALLPIPNLVAILHTPLISISARTPSVPPG